MRNEYCMNKTGGVLIVVALLSAGCSEPDAGPALKAAAPATVEHARTEAELSTVTLSPEAIKRLGIESVAASVQQVSGSRTLGGEVMVPEGRTVLVSAPVAGTLVSAGAVTAGARVRKGAAVFRLLPLAAGERDERIDVQRSAAQAEAEEQAARQRLTRLEQLLQDGAASVRAVATVCPRSSR